jgi:hypothetical protein
VIKILEIARRNGSGLEMRREMLEEPALPLWQKSTYSSAGNCVELAQIGKLIAMRDSKDPTGPVLMFTGDEWRAFCGGVLAGEFDSFLTV